VEVYFTTVVRKAPLEVGGEIVRVDWETKQILGKRVMRPPEPLFKDPNPRGNGRGGRGITKYNNLLYAATYHSLLVFDKQLNQVGIVSDHLFVGIHEVCRRERDNTLWVASTAIDAVVGINNRGVRIDSWWPRENRHLQELLSLEALVIDKSQDNRTLWLHEEQQNNPNHTHLNAVTFDNDQMYVLLNRKGVVYNVTRQQIIIEDSSLIGCHNLVFLGGKILINDSRGKRVTVFSKDGRKIGDLFLLKHGEVKAIYKASKSMANKSTRTIFVRGLSPIDEKRILVGFSPATVVEIDVETGKLLDVFQYSEDVAVCVHGLTAWV